MLLTGRYPTRTGFAFTPAPPSNGRFMAMLRDDGSAMPPTLWHREASAQLPPMHDQGMPGSEVTLAEMLQRVGYHTIHIGKWHLNTIVFFSSDNGGAGYVGLPEINAPYRGWKGSFFEGGIHTPFFLRWPARIAPGSQDARPAAHVDVVPTLAAAVGAPLPDGVAIDGIDLLAPDAVRNDDALFWQSGIYRVVRQGDWKLQLDARRERVWLHDLANDPTERVNLADAEPDRVAALRALLDDHLEGARAPIYPSYLEGPTPVDKTRAEPFVPGDEYVYWPN